MTVRAFLCVLLLLIAACQTDDGAHRDDVPVVVGMVAVDNNNAPVVILEERDGKRWLPIWVGRFEARSIASEMESEKPPRPNTHDLARSLIAELKGEVVRVVVTELRGGTFYAVLSLRRDGQLMKVDSRPSDAIAIALRTKAPIFVRAPVFDAAGESQSHEGELRIFGRPRAQPGGTGEATPNLEL